MGKVDGMGRKMRKRRREKGGRRMVDREIEEKGRRREKRRKREGGGQEKKRERRWESFHTAIYAVIQKSFGHTQTWIPVLRTGGMRQVLFKHLQSLL